MTCRWLHRFSAWSTVLIEDPDEDEIMPDPEVQFRMCKRCGHEEEREIVCVSS